MTMTIITQTEEIVNYGNVLQIFIVEGTYDGVEAFALVAEPIYIENKNDKSMDDKLIQLCVYDSEDKCRKVERDLIKWLKGNVQSVFEIPATVQEE